MFNFSICLASFFLLDSSLFFPFPFLNFPTIRSLTQLKCILLYSVQYEPSSIYSR